MYLRIIKLIKILKLVTVRLVLGRKRDQHFQDDSDARDYDSLALQNRINIPGQLTSLHATKPRERFQWTLERATKSRSHENLKRFS